MSSPEPRLKCHGKTRQRYGCQNKAREGDLLCGRCYDSLYRANRVYAEFADRRSPEWLIKCAMDTEAVDVLVKNDALPISFLCHFARHEDRMIRFQAALHQRTPLGALKWLAEDTSDHVVRTVAHRSDLPEPFMRNMLFSGKPTAVLHVLKSGHYVPSGEEWHTLASIGDEEINSAAMRSGRVPEHMLPRFADSDSPKILKQASTHSSDPAKLRALAERMLTETRADDAWLRVLLMNENTDAETVDMLAARCTQSYQWKMLAAHPNAPVSALRQIPHRCQDAIINAAKHPKATPELLAQINSEHKSYKVKMIVAGNLNAAPETLQELMRHNSFRVRCAVAGNPQTPVHILASMTRVKDERWEVLTEIAGNSATPSELLEDLIHLPGYFFAVRKAVAANPRALPSTLATLAKNENEDMRLAVSSNPSTSAETLREFADDSRQNIRLSVTRHANAPSDVLVMLAVDGERVVRERASRQLSLRKGGER